MIKSVCYFCVLLVVVSVLYWTTQTSQNVSSSPSEFCVVLDAGHGGIDTGSSGKTGVCERDLNLKITNKIESYLKTMNISVVQTRRSEEGLYGVFASGFKKKDMLERQKIIKNASPNLVVSIHMNYFSDPSVCGAEVFYKQSDLTSKMFAEKLQMLFQKNLKNARNSCKKGDFFILNCSESPGVLIECGYLSNPEEEQLLISEDYQNLVAYQIFCGIVSCFVENATSN